MLKDSDVDYSEAVAQRVVTRLEEPFMLEVASLHVSASIGIALAPEHAHSCDELLRCADVAMYRAKVARRPFDAYEDLSDDGRTRLRRIEELRLAIAEDSLALYLQPQFDLRTGEIPQWRRCSVGPRANWVSLFLASSSPLPKKLG